MPLPPALGRDVADGVDDVGIGPAAADVAAHPLAQFVDGGLGRGLEAGADMAGNAGLDLAQHRHRRADLAGRAVAALVAVVLDEGGLHRVQVVGRAQALDGGDLVAVVHDGQAQAAVDPPAVDHDRAGPALAVVAALLGAGQLPVLAQGVQQGGAVVQVQLVGLAVDLQRHRRARGRALGHGDLLGRERPPASVAVATPAASTPRRDTERRPDCSC
jgi:hypothetical protein